MKHRFKRDFAFAYSVRQFWISQDTLLDDGCWSEGTKMRMSSGNLSVFNPAALGSLIACIWLGWMTQYPSSQIAFYSNRLYSVVSCYFPFTTIGAIADASKYPNAAAIELTILWISAPLLWWMVASFSRRKAVKVGIGSFENKRAYVLLYIAAILGASINILFYIPETRLCMGCEAKTIVLGGIIKWVYFWMIGYSVGQIIAVLKRSEGEQNVR